MTYLPLRTPTVRCPYCGADDCRHPSRRDQADYIDWLLEHTGRDVMHVFARREGRSLVYDCLFCRKQHRHGDAYGTRVTHCPVGVPPNVILHPEEGP